ncbi:MAG: tetratricopeptide repeat protein [bacterium]|nr:tetratricopeptide repeat protein [bacterium]
MIGLFLFCLLSFHPLCAMDKDYYFTKSDFYIQMEDYRSAESTLSQIDVSRLVKKEKAMYYNKTGFIQFKLNNFNLALTNYFTARRIDPSLEYIYNNIGVIYFRQGFHTQAREYYMKALSVNSNYPRVLVNLAVNEFYIRNYTLAFQWYKKALQKDQAYVQERFDRKKGLNKLMELAAKYPEDQELQFLLKWAQENADRPVADR